MKRSIDDILTITQGGILYRDADGRVQWLDFVRCNRNWTDSRQNLSLHDSRCVGLWHFFPTYYVFYSDPQVRFELDTGVDDTLEAADEKLRGPMSRLGGWCFQYDG